MAVPLGLPLPSPHLPGECRRSLSVTTHTSEVPDTTTNLADLCARPLIPLVLPPSPIPILIREQETWPPILLLPSSSSG